MYFWVQNIKVPFGIGHPPLHIKPSLYVCRRVQGSQIFKPNSIISIHSRVIVILLILVYVALGGGAGGWGVSGVIIVYMSSGMFRGKESSNRIKLSRLVQELLKFGVFSFLRLLGVGGWWMLVGGGWGCPPHMCTCTHTHMHAHACVVNMVISCKWPPPLGKSLGIPYDVICACVHMHACVCMWMWVWCTPSAPPTPSTHPQGGPPESFKIQ